jgi:hypothetical protein
MNRPTLEGSRLTLSLQYADVPNSHADEKSAAFHGWEYLRS